MWDRVLLSCRHTGEGVNSRHILGRVNQPNLDFQRVTAMYDWEFPTLKQIHPKDSAQPQYLLPVVRQNMLAELMLHDKEVLPRDLFLLIIKLKQQSSETIDFIEICLSSYARTRAHIQEFGVVQTDLPRGGLANERNSGACIYEELGWALKFESVNFELNRNKDSVIFRGNCSSYSHEMGTTKRPFQSF